jgi:hypothetical protein
MECKSASTPRTAMISGHIDISPADFATYYIPTIDLTISHDDRFVLGDAQSTDTLALNSLLQRDGPVIKHRITIYASSRYNVAKFEAVGIATSTDPSSDNAVASGHSVRPKGRRHGEKARTRHLQRDARVTRASNYDILWTKSEEEARKLYGDKYWSRVSATELNRLRRLEVLEEARTAIAEGENVSGAKDMDVT